MPFPPAPQLISILLDLQHLYPPSWFKGTPLPGFSKWYLEWSRDPVLVGATYGGREWDWLRSFVYLEGAFQVPCHLAGIWGLWRNDKRVYPLLLAYGASTTTAMIPVLAAIFDDNSVPPLTRTEMMRILASYIPFGSIYLAIALDMGWRLTKIVAEAQGGKVKTA